MIYIKFSLGHPDWSSGLQMFYKVLVSKAAFDQVVCLLVASKRQTLSPRRGSCS